GSGGAEQIGAGGRLRTSGPPGRRGGGLHGTVTGGAEPVGPEGRLRAGGVLLARSPGGQDVGRARLGRLHGGGVLLPGGRQQSTVLRVRRGTRRTERVRAGGRLRTGGPLGRRGTPVPGPAGRVPCPAGPVGPRVRRAGGGRRLGTEHRLRTGGPAGRRLRGALLLFLLRRRHRTAAVRTARGTGGAEQVGAARPLRTGGPVGRRIGGARLQGAGTPLPGRRRAAALGAPPGAGSTEQIAEARLRAGGRGARGERPLRAGRRRGERPVLACGRPGGPGAGLRAEGGRLRPGGL